jgi:hypothetical protein
MDRERWLKLISFEKQLTVNEHEVLLREIDQAKSPFFR